MHITYTLTQNEFTEALKLHHKSKNLLVWTVVGTFLAIYFFLSTDFDSSSSILIQGISVLVAFGLYILLRKLLHTYVHKKHYQDTKRLSCEVTVDITEAGLHIKDLDHDTLVDWDDVSRWGHDEDFTMVYTSINAFHIIPTRAMSETQRETLHNYLEGKRA
jgi:hypothetical protein